MCGSAVLPADSEKCGRAGENGIRSAGWIPLNLYQSFADSRIGEQAVL